MTQPMGLTEFFAMEAGEYLERLDALVSPAAQPDAEEFLRLTRALRGSALMANQQIIADAAAGFEGLARAVREQRRSWDAATKQLAIRAVDDLKILVRSVGEWTKAADSRARGLAAELERAVGTGPASPAPREPQGLDAGTRAFLAREGAAVASSLHEAARGLQQNPLAHDPLDRVLKVMQPLRGLAILSEIPPVSDLLEGIQQAIGEVTRRRDRTDGADLLFEAAAKALARAAREIAADGRADAESAETRDFARRLSLVLELDAQAVPIESLYYEDGGPHIVETGTPAARPARLGRLELVSHGEHLRLAADELEGARSSTHRELRAQTLASTFRALAAATGGPLEDAVARFGQAARDALARGTAVSMTDAFAHQLREAGTILSEAAEGDERVLAQRLSDLVRTIQQLPAAPPAPARAAPTGGAPHRPPARSAEYKVPHARPQPQPKPSRQTTAPHQAVRSGAALEEPANLAGSWIRYERFGDALGFSKPSLDALLAGPPADPGAGDLPDLGKPSDVVPIMTLCYSGTAALERALNLRSQVKAVLAGTTPDPVRASELMQEVFDLVQLGLQHPD